MKCPFCQKYYKWEKYMVRHIAIKHPGKIVKDEDIDKVQLMEDLDQLPFFDFLIKYPGCPNTVRTAYSWATKKYVELDVKSRS